MAKTTITAAIITIVKSACALTGPLLIVGVVDAVWLFIGVGVGVAWGLAVG